MIFSGVGLLGQRKNRDADVENGHLHLHLCSCAVNRFICTILETYSHCGEQYGGSLQTKNETTI